MRLTKQTNYAVRVLMYCATNQGQLSRVPDIAAAYGLSETFLFKIIKPIIDHGLAHSVRGRKGGLELGKPAEDITLLDVVQLTEDNFAMAECFANEDTECPLVDACALNSAWSEALGAFFEVLGRHTIADLVKNRPKISNLLGLEIATNQTSLPN